jgi:hypothetical protein
LLEDNALQTSPGVTDLLRLCVCLWGVWLPWPWLLKPHLTCCPLLLLPPPPPTCSRRPTVQSWS